MSGCELTDVSNRERGLILIRHAAVAERYAGVCFGRSDVELSAAGRQHSLDLARNWKGSSALRIVHSGLERASFLARALVERCGGMLEVCPGLAERDFGDWELQTWDDIHGAAPGAMDRMLTEPATFRPGGGETTYELRDRVADWYASVDLDVLTIAVTHGGPIAALQGMLQARPVAEWPGLVPACGTCVVICGSLQHTSKPLSLRYRCGSHKL